MGSYMTDKQQEQEIILSVRDLVVKFSLRGQELTAIRGASLDLYKGECLAIVGESGSGKSVLTKSFMGMLDKNGRVDSGSILYLGKDLAKYKTEEEWIKIRGGEIAIVFQDPMTSLDPLMPVGKQIMEALELHQGMNREQAKYEAIRLLQEVGIVKPEERWLNYPHEFSGGMRQRVVIAIALACRPKILICDEPTTGLDVTIQAQILALLRKLKEQYDLTIVFITHDLGVVASIADRIAVLYAGDIVEIGTSREIFHDPRHPYTWALLSSMPQLGVRGKPLYSIEGAPPSLFQDIMGDAFAPRNRYALKIDTLERPPYFDISPTHKARTWLLDPRAPHVDPPNTSLAKAMEDNAKRSAEYHKKIGTETLLEVKNLTVQFGSSSHPFKAVRDVSFAIRKGETFGLVGESGSGKTTIGRAIIRINSVANGEIRYRGERISGKISRKLDHDITRKIQMVFQDPQASLNDRAKVSYIVEEGLINTHPEKSEKERMEKVSQALRDVGLIPEFATRFPHEFSGGQRQRIGLARCLVMEPEFLICDEPISALDVSVRAQVLNLLDKLQRKRGLTYLFISHDLSVMRFICDRIAVIYKGELMELAETEELFAHPLHNYTKALLSAVPLPDPDMEQHKQLITFDPEAAGYSYDPPSWVEIRPGHFVRGNQKELKQYEEELGREKSCTI